MHRIMYKVICRPYSQTIIYISWIINNNHDYIYLKTVRGYNHEAVVVFVVVKLM